MRFIKTSDWHPAIVVIQQRLEQELTAGKKVLWLVSGGSNIKASVTIMQNLPEGITQNLTSMLVDERYGVVGHEDSNGSQLLAAGFNPKLATVLPVLVPNTSFEATRDRYEEIAKQAFVDSDIIVAQLGIGTDGHTAGILPHSAAVDSPDFVSAYIHGPFQRLTLTHHALKRISVAYVLAYGADKELALELLSSKMISYSEQPAQILKELPEAYVFNDHIGEAV